MADRIGDEVLHRRAFTVHDHLDRDRAGLADAGAFDMSNNMTSVGQSAAGIMVAAQNSGMASLIQQGITVQANLTVGP